MLSPESQASLGRIEKSLQRLARIEKALKDIVDWGFCPDCGCDLANTEDCTWCGLITQARQALAKEQWK